MAAYKKGDVLTLPKRGYPGWTHGLKAVVHSVGPRGLLHLRIPFERHNRYITRSVRELAFSSAMVPTRPYYAPEHIEHMDGALTADFPADSTIESMAATIVPRKRRQRRAVSA